MTTSTEKTNPEIDQDRVFDLFDTFDKHECVMFGPQQILYARLARRVADRTVLEAGCGSGTGTALLARSARRITGTDKIERNVTFAACLYPWIGFCVWDINQPTDLKAEVVVCVETIEHVANPRDAMKHLIDAAEQVVWISTPNGRAKPRPPENPYHVCEYTPDEMLDMIGDRPRFRAVTIRNGETWELVDANTKADPLVYQIKV